MRATLFAGWSHDSDSEGERNDPTRALKLTPDAVVAGGGEHRLELYLGAAPQGSAVYIAG
jgi:hypothetical protein